MGILRDISLVWSMLHTLILFLFLFESRYSKKKTIVITVATMVPLILINLFLLAFLGLDKYGTLMLITLSLPSCIIFWLLAKYRNGRFFFTFCMVDTVVLEIVYITSILNHYLTPDTYLVMFFVRLISYPLIEILVYFKLRPVYLEVQKRAKKGWSIFAVIGLLFYVVITLLMTYPDNILSRPDQIPALVLMFILMPFIYLDIISTLRRQQQFYEAEEREKIMQLQVSNVVTRVEELSVLNEAFREQRHNFRHKLKAIESLVNKGQYEQLAKVLDQYEQDFEKTEAVRYCKIPIIDAVLSAYIRQARAANIDVKLGFAFPESFEANPSELATALANAIENAIFACEKLPEQMRHLEIKVLCRPKFVIMVRNTFDGTVEFDENGIPVNSAEEHGFGTRSIATFCTKLGGYYEFCTDGNVFTVFMHLK